MIAAAKCAGTIARTSSASNSIATSAVSPKDESTGHRADVTLRSAYRFMSRWRNLVATSHAIVPRKRSLLDTRSDEAFTFEPIQGGVDRSGRNVARRSLHDFVANR